MKYQFIADNLKLLSEESCETLDEVSKVAENLFTKLGGESRYISILNLDNMTAYKFDVEGFKRL